MDNQNLKVYYQNIENRQCLDAGTVPASKKLNAGTVPAYKKLDAGTLVNFPKTCSLGVTHGEYPQVRLGQVRAHGFFAIGREAQG